jgi:hypothetical protein
MPSSRLGFIDAVIPAKAGIQSFALGRKRIPAFAGMTAF